MSVQRAVVRCASFSLVSFVASLVAHAQCLQWASGFGGPGVLQQTPSTQTVAASASVVFDDGSGPALYVGGHFDHAGDTVVRNIARWNGTTWSDVGGGVADPVGTESVAQILALAVFDDGSGPALYAGGNFTTAGTSPANHVAKWNGSTWSALGTGVESGTPGPVRALCAFDDGSGPALYVGGQFDHAGGVLARKVARWNGVAWSSVGAGDALGGGEVFALAVYDDGAGPALFAGGSLTFPSGPFFTGFVRWDGISWTAPGPLDWETVRALSVYDDGAGAALYVSGNASGAGIVRWDGSTTTTIATQSARSLGVHDDGAGAQLVAGGHFDTIGAVAAKNIARWNGSSWSALAAGLDDPLPPQPFVVGVSTISSFGGALYAGGVFVGSATLLLNNAARWNGSAWSPMGDGDGANLGCSALTLHDDGSGVALYGVTNAAGSSVFTDRVGRWDGSAWSALSTTALPSSAILDLSSYDDGSGAALYAAGSFDAPGGEFLLARWDGAAWTLQGFLPSTQTPATDLAVFDRPGSAGAALYVGGAGPSVYQWDGTTLSSIGTTNGDVSAMCVYDGGTGPQLVIGGAFTSVAGVPAAGIARWNGTTWSSIGAGVGLPIEALAVGTEGGLTMLYAGVSASNAPFFAASVRRWNGSVWTNIGQTPTGQRLAALGMFGDGTPNGAALYVGGSFTSIGGVAAQGLARWNGSAWSAVDGGVHPVAFFGGVSSIVSFRGAGQIVPDLYVGGAFDEADGVPARGFTKLAGCSGPGEPFCFADGTLGVACPCVPPNVVPIPMGSPFGGCANSFNPHGASMTAIGTVNPDSIVLHATGLTPSGFTAFFKGDTQTAGGFGSSDGVRCASGTLIRFGGQNAVGGTAHYPHAPLGYTLPLTTIGGTPAGSGLIGYYQAYYRNPSASFCSSGTLNFTSGYRITWN